MTTIITINSTDLITNSRGDINTNFANLNSGKIETSVIDTDTALAANSDAKIPSQKAVKAYVDTLGNVNASTTMKGIVEEATVAEVAASTGTGGTGARLFINPTATKATSAGAGDVGKIPTLNSSGQLDLSFLAGKGLFKFGNTTKNLADASTTLNIPHGLGYIPKFIKLKTRNSNGHGQSHDTVYDGTTIISAVIALDAGPTLPSSVSTGNLTWAGSALNGTNGSNTVAITFDATNIILTITKNSTATGTVGIVWEAYA